MEPKDRSQLPTFHYLVMEYLDGITLDEKMWKNIEPKARVKIYEKLAEQLRLLRSIPPPGQSYYGRVHYQGYDPVCNMVRYRMNSLVGPFDTYEAFLQQVYNTLEINLIRRLIFRPEIYPDMHLFTSIFHDCFDKTSKGGEPKLSHMDLKLDNMMLVPSASNSSSDRIEDYDFYLIDWEMMCWLPAWAEIAGGSVRLPQDGHHNLVMWEMSKGIKPFPYAEANFYRECAHALGGSL